MISLATFQAIADHVNVLGFAEGASSKRPTSNR